MYKNIVLMTLLLPLTLSTVSVSANTNTFEVLNDFNGNQFKLVEHNNSYEIYDSKGIFIEGSLDGNSPYHNENGKKYYLGPGNYYVEDRGVVTNLFNGETTLIDSYSKLSYELASLPQTRSKEPTANPNETYKDTNGYTMINKSDYFKRLSYFPNNWFGECGTIALSMLLSYYDTFYNDDFIPNNQYYGGRYYEYQTKVSGSNGGYVLKETKNELLIKKTTTSYKNVNNYNFKDWTVMPGTNYAMRDYLFDKYMHTFAGLGWDDVGYPMLDGELKSTLKDYMNFNCNTLLNNTDFMAGHLFYTHQRPKEYIAQGLPTCLVLQSYDSTAGKGKSHVVIAYGYSGDKFITHFGWSPKSTSYATVILNKATIYGYFTIKYNGEHKCSSNVSMFDGVNTKYICGCGNVHS